VTDNKRRRRGKKEPEQELVKLEEKVKEQKQVVEVP